ncbi:MULTISPECIES: hypothetical protein [Providencia]|uniref:SpaN/EivJ family type III secretion system needle length determinant n=1 Tax=Providencia TaxID=586 RepID=UPI000D7DCA09|nr:MULTISPECIES: hypothetical protein [Providencia]AWS49778.1 hypothetical protein AM461_02610 [Providencia rettgeri]MCG5292639.1 hypothetical protein [Providencia rettgeri]MCL0019840.1 hypothetical protein [Providencia rettgeri]QZY64637.1 hypothetical protein K7H99_00850 [Providencia rettgeri]RFT08800.1 hypothetical protein DYB39_17795 [Providencia rettgeri]
MSVIKASSNDKVPHVVIEGKAMSSTYNTTEFSHQNITKKMAKLVRDKNMMKLFNHKSQNQQKDISIFLPVALSSMQQISQLSDLAKELITWKESAYIGEGNQTAEQNKELNIKETEPLINHYLFTENNNLDINPLPHLTTMDQAENVGALIVDNNANIKLQSNSLTEDQVEISYNLVADNNFDTNLITSTPTVDNNLPMTPNISAEQNITDEDETPLYNTMMVGFPLQNIPQRAKGKVSDNSVQYEKNKFQLSEKTQLNVESSLAELASKNTLRPTLKQLKPQIKTEQPHIEHAAKTVIKPVNPQEIGQELLKPIHHRPISSSDTTSLNMFPRTNNRLKDGALKNNSSLLGQQLVSHQVDDQQGIKQGIKDNSAHHVDAQLEFVIAEKEPFMLPAASQRITTLDNNKQISLSEKPTHHFSNEAQAAATSSQISSVEEIDPSTNIMATTLNEAMRPSVPLQVVQQKQEVHKAPELMENNPLLGEDKQPKSMGRSLTYTFNQWQSSPSVTFELASKGEFIASTASRDVQLALNENKHLLNHESSVQIRREDERQQQRNRQQHDQQQEED